MAKDVEKPALKNVFAGAAFAQQRQGESMFLYTDGLPYSYWQDRNKYYHAMMNDWYHFMIPQGATLLHINCKSGEILESLKPRIGVGIDLNPQCIRQARLAYSPRYHFHLGTIDSFHLDYHFDYILLSGITMEVDDIQQLLQQVARFCSVKTRVVIDYYAPHIKPLVLLAKKLRWHSPAVIRNWVGHTDMNQFLYLAGFEEITTGSHILWPTRIPFISKFLNKYVAPLPLLNALCMQRWIVARIVPVPVDTSNISVSVIVATRNERGNIERVVKECPIMGKNTEIIFVEGGSTDGTLQEIKRVTDEYKNSREISWYVQEGKGKGDAIRKGFAHAKYDVCMILDGDLTVPAYELPKFFDALVNSKGDFINGSRLVYGMESGAMQWLNKFANRFFGVQVSWIIGQRIKDTLCGTKVLWKGDYGRILANRSYFGMRDPFGDFDLLFGAAKLHLKIVDVPVSYKDRTYGTTNIQRFRDGFSLLKMTLVAMRALKFR